MKKINLYLATFIAAAALLVLTGCSRNSDPVGNNSSVSKVEGRVTGSEGHASANNSIEGAVVTLAKIEADGSLKTVSVNSVKTDASGRFLIDTELNGVSDLIVVASKGPDEWKAVVSSEVKHGITVFSQPLNNETTAEAEVYSEAKEEKYINIAYGDIANYLTAEAAVEIKGKKDKAKDAASAFKAEADACAAAFTHESIGVTASKLQEINNARKNAQAKLERDLFYAETNAAVNAAYDSYFNSIIDAYVNAGVQAKLFLKIMEISHRVFINKAGNAGNSMKHHFSKKAALTRAKVIRHIMEAKFRAAGASQSTIDAVNNASVQLYASISAANSYDEIIAAFENYQSIIINQLSTTLGIHASALASVEAKIPNFKIKLKNSVFTSIIIEAIIAAYMEFYENIKEECHTALAQAGETKADASAEILIMSNVHF